MWTDGIEFEQLGVRFGIRTDSPDLMELAASRLPPGWTPSASAEVDVLLSLIGGGPGRRGVRRYHILYESASILVRTLDRESLADALDSALHVALAERATRWLFVHAGVVGWHGRAMVMPGTTLSGKSSLVAALLRAGAVFYSDDHALIDEQGLVHPYPRPLSIRETPSARQIPFTASSFGAETGVAPLPVGLIAFTKYRAGASWAPRRVSAGQAMLALLEHTSAVRTRPGAALQTLQRTIAGATSYRGPRGEAAQTAERLMALI